MGYVGVDMMVWCVDCAWSKAFTIYDSWEAMMKLQHKCRCVLHNKAVEKDSPVCPDYERVS